MSRHTICPIDSLARYRGVVLLAFLGLPFAPGCGGTVDGGEASGGAGGLAGTLPTGERCDDLCDGTEETCYSYTYDVAGNVTLRKIDVGCDGNLNECDHNTYDAQGRLTAQTQDACDGFGYYCASVSYGAGQEGLGEGDLKCDGTVDGCFTLVYDGSGTMIGGTGDSECDSTPDACMTFANDEAERRIALSDDLACDGTTDVCYNYTYEFDELERATRKTETTCDGTVVACCTYSYD